MSDLHVSLDLETLGTSASSPVLSIGLVVFNRGRILSRHEWFLDLQEQLDRGARPDASTILWWLGQDECARNAQVHAGRISVASVLAGISATIPEECSVWGNGSSFDLFRRHGHPVPWNFWRERDLRTALSLRLDVQRIRPLTPHCALADAEAQALTIQQVL
jgi:3' exoribonuclease, RNase T-like